MSNPDAPATYAVTFSVRFFMRAVPLDGGAVFDPVATTRDELAHSDLAELLEPLLAALSDYDLPKAMVISITAEPVRLAAPSRPDD